MSSYWFARSGSARYPHAMVPVTWQGRMLSALLFVLMLAAWVGIVVAAGNSNGDWTVRLLIAAAAVAAFAAYLLVAFWLKGDRHHTDKDYKAGSLMAAKTGDSN